MSGMIAFKTWNALDQWRNLHPTLRLIVAECLSLWPDPYMEVTRVADRLAPLPDGTPQEESGVHWAGGPPHRAIDLRTNDMPPAEATKVEHVINTRWYYGDKMNPSRKCAIQHGEGANRHLHLQVRDQTHARFTESIASTPPLPGGGA